MAIIVPGAVDLGLLEQEILANQRYQRWEASASKQGFSGLSFVQNPDTSDWEIQILWTDDGENAYVRQLTATQELAVQRLIDRWIERNGFTPITTTQSVRG